MAENLPDIKIGETVAIQDGVFVGCYGEFKGWYYKYNHGWRCKVDISDLEDVEFLPEQIF
jgi:hypothetical protein